MHAIAVTNNTAVRIKCGCNDLIGASLHAITVGLLECPCKLPSTALSNPVYTTTKRRPHSARCFSCALNALHVCLRPYTSSTVKVNGAIETVVHGKERPIKCSLQLYTTLRGKVHPT